MSEAATTDVALIGAGIMSATLGTLLKELEPSLSISIFEVLSDCALESSGSWNNAGTGHAANCELNYTPQRPDGSVDISKALEVNTEFDLSRQLWAYLVGKGAIPDPRDFIHPCPHMSFVWGEANVAFLKARFKAMSANHCYRGMEYSADKMQIRQWIPLVMEGRDPKEIVAATRMRTGTDVDYGALTSVLLESLRRTEGFSIEFLHRVQSLKRATGSRTGARWIVVVRDEMTIKVEVRDDASGCDGLKEHIEKRLHSDLGLKLAIELVPEDALIEWSNRGREGKPKRILDQRYDKK